MPYNGGGDRSYKNNGGCIVTPPTPTYSAPTRDYSRAYERAEAYTQTKQYVSQSVQTTYNQKIEAQAAWNQHVQKQERIEQQVTKYSYKKGGNTSVVTAEDAKKEAVQVHQSIKEAIKSVIGPQAKKNITTNSKTNNIKINLENTSKKFDSVFNKTSGSLEDRAKQACDKNTNDIIFRTLLDIGNFKSSFDLGVDVKLVDNLVLRPIINLIGLLEKAVTGSSSNSDRAKSNLDSATNWIKEEIPSNQSAYEAGEKVGTVGALIISLYNLANGISSILSLLESGNGVFVQIPSLLQDLNAFGDALALADSSGVTIPIDASSIASITSALFQLSSLNDELSSESDDNSDNEGKWVKVNETMPEHSREYQEYITGHTGEAYVQNGVKYDGYKDGYLIETKAHYNQFIDKSGKFYNWFKETGLDQLKGQASRQIKAANGKPIKWVFEEKEIMELIIKEFQRSNISEITFEWIPYK